MYVRIYVCMSMPVAQILPTYAHTYVRTLSSGEWMGGREEALRAISQLHHVYCRWMMRSHPATPKAVFVDECVLGEGLGLGEKERKNTG